MGACLSRCLPMLELRKHQEEAVRWLVPRNRGFIVSPAGSGKTIIGACALAYRVLAAVKEAGFKKVPACVVAWVCNTTEQKDQAIQAIESVPGPQFADVRVVCAASGLNLSDADFVVFDEAHHCPAETWTEMMMQVRPEAVLWGFSATPFGEDTVRNTLVRAAFREFFTVDREELITAGFLMPGKVYVHDVDRPGEFDAEIEAATVQETRIRVRRFPLVSPAEHYRRAKWQVTQEFLYKNENRNSTICALAKKEMAEKSVLLLVSSVEHGVSLVERIPGAHIVHSKVGAKARRALIADFRSGTIPCLAATSLADEGLDVPRASVLVLAAGGRSSGKLEQRAGRVLRPFAGKTGGIIHDLLDRGALFAHAQARSRMKTYEKLGYNPEIISATGVPVVQGSILEEEMTGEWEGFR